jgi:hypothetical protein
MNDFILSSIIVLLIILAMFSFIGMIVFTKYLIENKQCLNSYELYQPQYKFWAGCRIMVDGKLTPTDIVRELK